MKETDVQHVVACPRTKAIKVWHLIPVHFVETLEQNQQIASCCRHPEDHEIEVLYSTPKVAEKRVPDIYKFHCTCGRTHARLCVGGGDPRPSWEIR